VLLRQDPPTQPPHIPPKPQDDENVYYNTSEMLHIPAQESEEAGDVYYSTPEMICTQAYKSEEGRDVYYSTPEKIHTPTGYYNNISMHSYENIITSSQYSKYRIMVL